MQDACSYKCLMMKAWYPKWGARQCSNKTIEGARVMAEHPERTEDIFETVDKNVVFVEGTEVYLRSATTDEKETGEYRNIPVDTLSPGVLLSSAPEKYVVQLGERLYFCFQEGRVQETLFCSESTFQKLNEIRAFDDDVLNLPSELKFSFTRGAERYALTCLLFIDLKMNELQFAVETFRPKDSSGYMVLIDMTICKSKEDVSDIVFELFGSSEQHFLQWVHEALDTEVEKIHDLPAILSGLEEVESKKHAIVNSVVRTFLQQMVKAGLQDSITDEMVKDVLRGDLPAVGSRTRI